MNTATMYVRRHAAQIDRNVSFVGALGLGYLLLRSLKCALPLSILVIFLMACAKVCIVLTVKGKPIIPPGKPLTYRVAWRTLFGVIVAFLLITTLIWGAAVVWTIFE